MHKRILRIIATLFRRYREFILYCAIGVSGVAVDFFIFSLGMEMMHLNYQISNFISFSFANASNFTLNAIFNFKIKDHLAVRFLCFYVIGLFSWFLGASCLYTLFEKGGLNVYISKFFSLVVVTAVQFTLNKTVSFKKKKLKNGL